MAGNVLRFGTKSESWKSGKGRDTDSGIRCLISEGCGLPTLYTTYETARDYQQSFAQIEFGVAVFDEIQKAKNPRSFIRQGVSAINAGFKIGLSGTPVENSIADLWVLMDIVAEGLIKKSLKEFIAAYSGDLNKPETLMALTTLHNELLQSRDGLPPPIMRRMKDEVFKEKGPDGSPC